MILGDQNLRFLDILTLDSMPRTLSELNYIIYLLSMAIGWLKQIY